MKFPLVPAFLFVAALPFLAGCDPERDDDPQPVRKKSGGFTPSHQTTTVIEDSGGSAGPGSTSTTTTETTHEERDHERDHDRPKPPTSEPVQKPANVPPPVSGNFEYGKVVPGKPGFVTSPYAPYQGYVDVRGYAPGTEVKDPYTGKTFLVPAQ